MFFSRGDGTCQNTESTTEEAEKTTQGMTESAEQCKFNTFEKCPLERSTIKIYINIFCINILLGTKNSSIAKLTPLRI